MTPNELSQIASYAGATAIEYGYFLNRMPELPFSLFEDDVVTHAEKVLGRELSSDECMDLCTYLRDKYSHQD